MVTRTGEENCEQNCRGKKDRKNGDKDWPAEMVTSNWGEEMLTRTNNQKWNQGMEMRNANVT